MPIFIDRMKVILPVLFGQDFSRAFLNNIVKEADEAVVLGIIDADKMEKASGSEMANIAEIEGRVEKVEDYLIRKGVNTKSAVQWGEMERIITNTAKLHKANKVVLLYTPEEFFPKIVRILKKELSCELEVV